MVRNIFRVASAIGIVLASLSLVTLTRLAIDIGLSAPIHAMLEYYDTLVTSAFAWADPIAKITVNYFSNLFRLRLNIDPAWKHILVLLWLYFSADARANWGLGRAGFSIFTIVWGVFVGFLGSIAAGTTALTEPQLDLLAVFFPVASLVLFEMGRSTWSAIFKMPPPSKRGQGMGRAEIFCYLMMKFPISIVIVGTLVFLTSKYGLSNQLTSLTNSQNLTVLALFVLTLLLLFLGRGIWQSFTDRAEAETWRERFARSGSARVGILMLITVMGALAVIIGNAGLSALGL